MDKDIKPLGTGKLSVDGVGRVGNKDAARRARRCRPRKYWAVFEYVAPNRIERTEFGKFKSKRAANKALLDFANANNYPAKTFGNPPNIDSYIDVEMKSGAAINKEQQ